jgi:hypothetical protein
MDSTEILVTALVSLVISAGSTYAVIRLSPERKDLKRVRELLDGNAEQQRLSNDFNCDVEIQDLQTEGANLVLQSEMPFQLKQVQLATESGAPLSSIEPGETGLSTRHEVRIPAKDIGRVFFSQPGGMQKTGLLTFTANINGHLVERKRAVTVLQLMCANPTGHGQTMYFHMG